ncbi:MAG: Nif3-like dinuclear metal center hexameric protein [Eubacteriales bacterium]|nr:Nif3-like dinuclear metal center hexameric protein [Eubacteriales bacterium]
MVCEQVMQILDALSPKKYACEWDNVGLLVGRPQKEVKRIMVALDATKEVVEEAVANGIDMLITHHPMIFSAMKQVSEGQFTQEKVLTLAEHGICYYAMHTNFDAVGGMADLAAGEQYLNLTDVSPIEPCNEICEQEGVGMGRYGKLPKPMKASEVAEYVKQKFHLPFVMLYQDKKQAEKVYERIAVMPGSGKSVMKQVLGNGYDLLLTGDYGHHEGIDAMDMGLTVIDATHYGLEYIFIDFVCAYLQEQCKEEDVVVSKSQTGAPVTVL